MRPPLPGSPPAPDQVDGVTAGADPGFEALIAFLRRTRGLDLTGYKRPSLQRRVRRRMQAVGCERFEDYVDVLEVQAGEFEALFDTLLINVTEFFRDPDAWDDLRSLLPELLGGVAEGDGVRVWSAGCSTGQEAYTLAMLLAEQLGPEAYRERVKIYATDIDEGALARARQAEYDERELAGVPAELRERYFEPAGGRWAFRKDLCPTVIFGRNHLIDDAPISRLDLLVCRNTLMYFTAEAQARILQRFHFALRDAGVLMLGRSETMLGQRDRFTALERRTRLFRRRLRDTPASRPADLQIAIEQALRERRRVALGQTTYRSDDGDEQRLDIAISPLLSSADAVLGVSVLFEDVTRSAQMQGELEGNRRDLELAYEELQSTIDELETTNEELQSANEELQTTSEQLQSTNEELETMNEELQLTNEELETTNGELRERTGALDRLNGFQESILSALGVGVIVLDRDHRVQVWNRRAEDLWGLRREDTLDRHVHTLAIGLPTDELAAPLRAVLTGVAAREVRQLRAVDRRGRTITCATTVLPLRPPAADDGAEVPGAIVLMEDRLSA